MFSKTAPVCVFRVEVADGEDFSGGGAVSCAGDAARSIERVKLVASVLVEVMDAVGELIGENDWAGVISERIDEAYLVFPGEGGGGVLGEFDIVGRVGVDEVGGLERESCEVLAGELPGFQEVLEG